MGNRQKRGDRESPWLVARRCLALLRRVQAGPAQKDALLAAVMAGEGAEAYGGSEGKALADKFTADKARLRDRLGVTIGYSAAAGGYVIEAIAQPLLALPEAHLHTLAIETPEGFLYLRTVTSPKPKENRPRD